MEQEIKSDPRAVKAFKDRWENSLTISRVPPKTLESFKKLAKDEFVDDYGMTLKWIMDLVFGVMPTGNEEIYARLDMLEAKLNEIKQEAEKPKPKIIKMVGGTIINKK